MKRLIAALLATSTMALAVPAFAHDPQQNAVNADEQWNNGGRTYGDFNQEYQHIWEGIQHGASDGTYTQNQAQQYYNAMQQIRARADAMQRSGRYDPRDIQARLEQLHDTMHDGHEQGHAMQNRGQNGGDDWNNGGGSYAEFNREYQHIWQGIQHGVNDGTYSRSQAQQYYRAMQQIKARADAMQRSGRYNPQDIQSRLERLHDMMHDAHEGSHDQQDRYGYGGYRR